MGTGRENTLAKRSRLPSLWRCWTGLFPEASEWCSHDFYGSGQLPPPVEVQGVSQAVLGSRGDDL